MDCGQAGADGHTAVFNLFDKDDTSKSFMLKYGFGHFCAFVSVLGSNQYNNNKIDENQTQGVNYQQIMDARG